MLLSHTYDSLNRVTKVETASDGKTYQNGYTYDYDRIKTVSHNTTSNTVNDVTYTFDYDALGRKTTVKVGTQELSKNIYEDNRSGLLKEVDYGNGGKVKYTYDGFDRLTGVKYDAETADRYEYKYGANGQAAEVVDNNLNRTVKTSYDLANRPSETELRDNVTNSSLYHTHLWYDKLNNLQEFTENVKGERHTSKYAYDRDNRITSIVYDGDDTNKASYTYDELGRVNTRTVSGQTSTYSYVAGGYGTNSTSPLVSKISQPQIPFEYTYDNRGNIISEKRGTLTTTYAYDALGQLIRVNDPNENATWVYNYDRGGNILSKVKYAYTTGALGTPQETIPYVYGDSNWKDKLTSYNGQTITYDAIGNPLNDGIWSYEWQAGRQLQRMSVEGMAVSFKYDYNGLRTQKIVEADWYPVTTNYTLHGKLITHMNVNYYDWDEVEHNDTMHFFYDAQSRPAMVEFNGEMYTYVHNLQGDIVGILDSLGNLMVEYKYDAWGKLLSTTGWMADTLGARNPFRYRGYVYDDETGLYYLRSRYYNPVMMRFINLDNLVDSRKSLLNNNLFAYVRNCPVLGSDPSGHWANWLSVFFAGNPSGILVRNKEVYTGTGRYPLYSPPKWDGPYYAPIYTTVAHGQSSLEGFSYRALALNIGTHELADNPISGVLGILNIIKDSMGMLYMDVYIETAPGNAPRARITMHYEQNASFDPLGTGMVTHGHISSPTLIVSEITSDAVILTNGQNKVAIYDLSTFQNLVEGIQLIETEGE